jgi:hypothetical protein
MMRTFILLMLAISWMIPSRVYAQPKLIGIFDGRTPCTELAKVLNQEPVRECIKMKWRLKLFTGSTPGTGTYELEGMTFREGNQLKGTWTTTRGVAIDPQASVIVLELPNKNILQLLKADEHVLFFLDSQKKLMVGNYDFSYTLNRVPGK